MGNSTGAQLLARMLKAEGVRHVFTLSGLHVAPVYAACVEEGIAIVDTRHEQGAAHAADATARLTRGIGVCCVTAGPGVTDALTGIANAWAASSPVLLLGGAAPTFNAGKGSLQEMEQVDLFTRITKWSDRIPAADRVPDARAAAGRSAADRAGGAPDRERRARRGDRRQLGVLGRRRARTGRVRRARGSPGLPERRRPRRAAGGPSPFLLAHAQGGAGGGRGGAG